MDSLQPPKPFIEVWQAHRPMLFNIAYSRLRNTADAEDVLQNAALVAWRKHELEQPKKPGAWFRRIVQLQSLQLLDRRSGQPREFCDESMTATALPRPGAIDDDSRPFSRMLYHFAGLAGMSEEQVNFLALPPSSLNHCERATRAKLKARALNRALAILTKTDLSILASLCTMGCPHHNRIPAPSVCEEPIARALQLQEALDQNRDDYLSVASSFFDYCASHFYAALDHPGDLCPCRWLGFYTDWCDSFYRDGLITQRYWSAIPLYERFVRLGNAMGSTRPWHGAQVIHHLMQGFYFTKSPPDWATIPLRDRRQFEALDLHSIYADASRCAAIIPSLV